MMVIYKTTNLLNGKYYIGKQKKYTKGYFGSGVALRYAIKKYGKINFKKEILEICNSDEELQYAEIKWIDKLNGVKDKKCYNLVRETSSNKHRSYNDPEFKRKLSESLKKTLSDPTQKIRMSIQNSGKNNPMFGRKRSKKFKNLISNVHKGKIISDLTKEKIRLWHIGKRLSTKTKLKMSKINRNRWDNIKILLNLDGENIQFNNRFDFKDYIKKYNKYIPRGRVRGTGKKRINYKKAIHSKYSFITIIKK
jgi:group I intron endonuclease